MTRARIGRDRAAPRAHRPRELVGSALERTAKILGDHHVELDIPADLPMLELDPVLFDRCCQLLDNAAKYAPPGSLIPATRRVRSRPACGSRQRRGPGIAPADLEKSSTNSIRVHAQDRAARPAPASAWRSAAGFIEAMGARSSPKPSRPLGRDLHADLAGRGGRAPAQSRGRQMSAARRCASRGRRRAGDPPLPRTSLRPRATTSSRRERRGGARRNPPPAADLGDARPRPPRIDGLEVIRRLARRGIGGAIIVLTSPRRRSRQRSRRSTSAPTINTKRSAWTSCSPHPRPRCATACSGGRAPGLPQRRPHGRPRPPHRPPARRRGEAVAAEYDILPPLDHHAGKC